MRNKYKKLLIVLVGIIISTVAVIILIIFFPNTGLTISNWRKDLITTVIGSGLFAGIISATFFYLQESNRSDQIEERLKNFYNSDLLPKVVKIIKKGRTQYDLANKSDFYLNGSYANPLYKLYQDNKLDISEYITIFPKESLCNSLVLLASKIESVEPSLTKLETLLWKIARTHHHSKGVDAFNDKNLVNFLRVAIFTKCDEQNILEVFEWKEIPEDRLKLKEEVLKNETIIEYKKLVEELHDGLNEVDSKLEEAFC